MEFCGGGELYALLMAAPRKRLAEAHMRFYAAEVLLALQYLHLLGFVYRHVLAPADTPRHMVAFQPLPDIRFVQSKQASRYSLRAKASDAWDDVSATKGGAHPV